MPSWFYMSTKRHIVITLWSYEGLTRRHNWPTNSMCANSTDALSTAIHWCKFQNEAKNQTKTLMRSNELTESADQARSALQGSIQGLRQKHDIPCRTHSFLYIFSLWRCYWPEDGAAKHVASSRSPKIDARASDTIRI